MALLLRNHLLSCRRSLKTPPFPLTHHRPITTSSPQVHQNNNNNNNNNKQPLHSLFMEAVGLADKTPTTQRDEESHNSELKKNLKQLEEEVRGINGERSKGKNNGDALTTTTTGSSKRRSLYSVFTNQPDGDGGDFDGKGGKVRDLMVLKVLSPEMKLFVEHLFRNGYFSHANFAKGKENFDLSWFDSYFARGYIRFAAKRFGRDNQNISKWLSGSALKKVAVFGCPSAHKSTVFPAKKLRKFLEVPENIVCSKCVLRKSCKFENRSVWQKGDTKTLEMVAVMKILTSYALEVVDDKLVVPAEVKNSVSQLLKEVVNLSQTT